MCREVCCWHTTNPSTTTDPWMVIQSPGSENLPLGCLCHPNPTNGGCHHRNGRLGGESSPL